MITTGGIALTRSRALTEPLTRSRITSPLSASLEACASSHHWSRELQALGRVEHETSNGQDVTAQYVDLGARLKIAQQREAVLMRLMQRAHGISQILQLRNVLEEAQLLQPLNLTPIQPQLGESNLFLVGASDQSVNTLAELSRDVLEKSCP